MLLSAARPIASLTTAEALNALQSQLSGLDNGEALRRRSRFGANQLPAVKRRPLVLRFGDQLRHFMALMLWAAGSAADVAAPEQAVEFIGAIGVPQVQALLLGPDEGAGLLGAEAPLLDRRQDVLLHHPHQLAGIGGTAEQQGSDRDPIGWQRLQGRHGLGQAGWPTNPPPPQQSD